jgi:alkanesulfonate monooxygenase SsuD/methylene tetrahydromethanopterin reductase-like flavin-dependent oxidoreductase (luciferase family)
VRPLRKLGFLTIGLFEEDNPRRGHESTLEIIELGEQLGFDSVWVRHRHLQFGISSPVAVLAAASQRTRRAPDLVGTSAQLAERLWDHVAFREIDEVAFALPFTFEHEDYVQILTDIATRLGPALGWQPAAAPEIGTGT